MEPASRPEPVTPPPWHCVDAAVARALEEDLGLAGDVTTAALVPPDAVGLAAFGFRSDGVLAGTWAVEAVCARFDLSCAFEGGDGDVFAAGEVAGHVEGSLADLLTAERTMLNFLCHLSGVATATRVLVEACGDAPVRVRDTRKTTPGLRALEKAAVRAGGGANHRFGLFDAILVKDNHVAALGGDVAEAVRRARAAFPALPVEVEADTAEQALAAAAAGCDLVLLDNMTPAEVRDVVTAFAARGLTVPTEVSGGLGVSTVADHAATGVRYLAVGAITHSAPVVDIGLDLLRSGTFDDDEF